MKTDLTRKIAKAMWIMTTVGTVTAMLMSGSLLISSHRESVRGQLQAAATSLISLGISDFSELKDYEELNLFIEDALQMEKANKIVRVFDRSRRLIFTTVRWGYDKLPNRLGEELEKPTFVTLTGEARRYESLVIPYQGGAKRFYLQVAIPLPPYTEIFQTLWWQFLLLLALFIGISIGLSRWLARRLLLPVEKVARHLEGIDPNDHMEWKPINLGEGGQYLDAIVQGINQLGLRTREAILNLRKMSRYVAHELRTPLTILQGEAETVLQKADSTKTDYEAVLKSSLEEVHRMGETVTTVLQIGDQGRKVLPQGLEPLRLTPWVRENRPRWEKTLGRPIGLDLPNADGVVVQTPPNLLYQLVDNLVRNVRDHTPPGSPCRLRLESRGDEICLSVIDQGPGLPAKDLQLLNEKGSASEVAGVGLHLGHRIAESSGLKLKFGNSAHGGLQVEIFLDCESKTSLLGGPDG